MPPLSDIRERYARGQIDNFVFWVPPAYLYQVRLGTPWKMLSWLFIYLMPCAFYGWLWQSCDMSGAPVFVLVTLAVVTIYELGYIFNDTVAIHKEHQPAIRLYEENMVYFRRHAWGITAARAGMSAAFLAALPAVSPYAMYTIAAVIAIIPIFVLYNLWRGKWNVLLYPVLLFSRYVPFLVAYGSPAGAYVLLFLSVPCLNMIERYSMPRYRFALIRLIIPDEKAKTMFRVWYYAVVIALLYIVWYCAPSLFGNMPLKGFALMLVPFYLLLGYRAAIALITRYRTPRNYLNG